MKFWRVIMSTHHQRDDNYRYSAQIPTFYVHACDAVNAKTAAYMVCGQPCTSGSVVEVELDSLDVKLTDVPGMNPLNYLSWSDL